MARVDAFGGTMRNSHITPIHYLAQFATKTKPSQEGGILYVYEKDKKYRKGSTLKEGREIGYFDLKGDERMEDELQKLEDDGVDILQSIPSPMFWLSLDAKYRFSRYVAQMHARTRVRKESNATLLDFIKQELQKALHDESFLEALAAGYSRDMKVLITANTIRTSLENIVNRQDKNEVKEAFITSILHHTEHISKMIRTRGWRILKAPSNEQFVTSDNPVVTAMPINGLLNPGWGFNKEGVLIFFPVRYDTCVVIGSMCDEMRTASIEDVRSINEVLIRSCHRFVYSHSYSEPIEQTVNQYAKSAIPGKTAFVLSKEKIPSAKNYLLNYRGHVGSTS